MARVTWHIEGDERNISNGSVGAPVAAGELWAWFKAARTANPKIPIPDINTKAGWFISNSCATLDVIVFEMHNANGERGFAIIDRRAPAIGF